MNTESILQELKAERDRVNAAIAALEPLGAVSQVPHLVTTDASQTKTYHTRTPEWRAKQSRRMKQIWAQRRAA